MNITVDGNLIRPNMAFTVYFTAMCCLYTNTYIQLLAQLGILAYVFLSVLRSGLKVRLAQNKIHNLSFYFVWFGAFTLLLYVSKYWAYSIDIGSKTMLTVFRIFAIGAAIFVFVSSKKIAFSVMQSFIIACFIMGVVALLTSIHAIGTTDFGVLIGQHRNQIGAVAAPLTFLCLYMHQNFQLKYGRALSVYFAVLTICTGSRSSILQLVLIYCVVILISSDNMKQKSTRLAIFGLVSILVVAVIHSVPFLYENIWVRINEAVLTVTGTEVADRSAQGRDNYKEVAFFMFLNRPWLGYGLDGFKCFLRDHPYLMGYYMAAVYSHCNYAEIAADLGVAGLVIWYVPVFRFLRRHFAQRKICAWNTQLISIFISMVAFDYSRIPWETHLIMYLYFTIMLLIKWGAKENAVVHAQNQIA